MEIDFTQELVDGQIMLNWIELWHLLHDKPFIIVTICIAYYWMLVEFSGKCISLKWDFPLLKVLEFRRTAMTSLGMQTVCWLLRLDCADIPTSVSSAVNHVTRLVSCHNDHQPWILTTSRNINLLYSEYVKEIFMQSFRLILVVRLKEIWWRKNYGWCIGHDHIGWFSVVVYRSTVKVALLKVPLNTSHDYSTYINFRTSLCCSSEIEQFTVHICYLTI